MLDLLHGRDRGHAAQLGMALAVSLRPDRARGLPPRLARRPGESQIP